MKAFLLFITLSANLVMNVLSKTYQKRQNGKHSELTYILVTSLVATVILACMGGIKKCSLFTLFLGIGFGAVNFGLLYSLFLSYLYGPYTYTFVIFSLATLLPTFSGCIFWNERVYISQFVGIICMVLSFVLIVGKKDDAFKFSYKWLGFAICAFLLNGIVGIMQKWHQSTNYYGESTSFLFIAFAFSSLLSFIALCINKNASGGENEPITKKSMLILLAVGVALTLNHVLNLYLSGVLDSAIMFPVVNGGGMVLNVIAGMLIFREKVSVKARGGILLGIISTVCVCLRI